MNQAGMCLEDHPRTCILVRITPIYKHKKAVGKGITPGLGDGQMDMSHQTTYKFWDHPRVGRSRMDQAGRRRLL